MLPLKKEKFMSVRVRFAPSPTGPLHIGGLRTALYNYLFAKQHQGVFILRIEDTDQARFVEGAESYIQDCLRWAQIEPDESPLHHGQYGPYRQSERYAIYQEYIQKLIDNNKAYYAFDSTEDLEQKRTEAAANNEHFSYDSTTRAAMRNSLTLAPSEVQRLLTSGAAYVVRFKVEPNRQMAVNDEVRDRVLVNSNTLDDKVLFKSDGMPTYHLANVVDDHLMKITHVIRGEEWLPSLPLHYMLYEAFDWTPPTFAHLPLILRPDGKGKLSKRDGELGGFPVYPLKWNNIDGFKESGFLSAPLLNFLALLGWSTKSESEVLSIEDMALLFSMKGIQKAGGRFDVEKLRWFNQHYLQGLSDEALAETCIAFSEPLRSIEKVRVKTALILVRERLIIPQDLYNEHGYFFTTPESYDEKAVAKQWKEETGHTLADFVSRCVETDFSEEALEGCLKKFVEEKTLSIGALMAPLRLALVGALKGPSVYSIMQFIGREEASKRIARAIQFLQA